LRAADYVRVARVVPVDSGGVWRGADYVRV